MESSRVNGLKGFKKIKLDLSYEYVLPMGEVGMKMIDEAMKEELKNYVIIDPIERMKEEEERKFYARQSGQKKFRKGGNNRKKTRGRK